MTVSGGGASRVFQVDGGVTASISGMTITGRHDAGNGGGLANYGGTTTLTNCTVSGNSAASCSGGGLYSLSGTTTLTNCTVSGNSCQQRRRRVANWRHDHADRLHRQRQLAADFGGGLFTVWRHA